MYRSIMARFIVAAMVVESGKLLQNVSFNGPALGVNFRF